jgi:hypothetical protein
MQGAGGLKLVFSSCLTHVHLQPPVDNALVLCSMVSMLLKEDLRGVVKAFLSAPQRRSRKIGDNRTNRRPTCTRISNKTNWGSISWAERFVSVEITARQYSIWE